MSSIVKYIGLIAVAAFGLAGCGQQKTALIQDMSTLPQSPGNIGPMQEKTGKNIPPRQEIRLGFLVPLSGPDAAIGTALLNAATLALFDSRDRRLVLLPHDTRGSAEGAKTAMTQLLKQRPDLIIGPLFSASIKAIKPMAKRAGINVIGFSSDYTVAGDGVFLMNFPMEEQVERIIRYASDQGYARYAALIPETVYGSRALKIFRATVASQNRDLSTVKFYPPDSQRLVGPVKAIARYDQRHRNYIREIKFLKSLGKDDDFAREMLEKLKSSETIGGVNFDALLLPEGGTMLTTLTAWISYYEIDSEKIKILGTGLWDDKMLFLEPQLYGGWFAAPDHRISRIFLKRYAHTYGRNGPRLVTLAYDAVALAATLVRHSPLPDFSAEQLTSRNGFLGLDGLFRFSPSGLIERGLTVYQVGPKKFTVIDPAPKSFINRDRVKLLTIKSGQEDHSTAAAPAPLPANDERPFPYNPVQENSVTNHNQ
ncbi:MAG: penicillin-binding protein activator [Alphaproteobacteria bacterium]|nr:penicillin-binding protein activator [Alphaproteobacteria bacterium]